MQVEVSTVGKIISVLCGIGIIVMCIFRIFSFNISNPQHLIMTIHYIIFGIILASSEFGFKYVVNNFALLKKRFGKGIFMFFIGTIMITQQPVYQLLLSIILIVVGILYMMLQLVENKYNPVANKDQEPGLKVDGKSSENII